MNRKDEQETTSTYDNVKQLIDFMKVMKISRKSFVFSMALSFFAVFLNLITIRLLMDLLRGMIVRDFEFIRSVAGFKSVVALFPGMFETSSSLFVLLIATMFFLTFVVSVLQYGSTLSIGHQGREASRSMRELIFDRYLSFGKLFYDRVSLGRVNIILVKFSQAVSAQLNSLQRLVSQIFSLAAYFGIMFYISWQLTLLTCCIFPFFVFLSQKAAKRYTVISKDHAKSEQRLDERIFGVFSAIPLIKAHGTEDYERKIFREVNESEAEAAFQVDKKVKLLQPIQEIYMMVAFLILACAVTFIIPPEKGHIANYLVFFYLVRMSLPGFAASNKLRMALSHSKVRIDMILDVLNDEKKFIITGGKEVFEDLRKAIELKKLNFGYRDSKRVLYDISITLEKGKTTAIVGPTGSGKTTLVHLLLRFYDCEPGTILVDGKDIRNYTLKSLSRHFAYVSQDAFFFNDTIRMNMTYGLDKLPSNEELVDVAKKARLVDFIMGLPQKFETKVGDRGVQLSGGEKQRLSIVRALLRDAEILILDEATSSMDSTTEKLIQEAIQDAVEGKTTIVIAHRFSTIQNAHKIVVLDQGRLVEQGTLESLLAQKGKFYDYWNEQNFF